MSIIQRQELPENIELLAAQRNLYSRAKNIIGFQMVLSIPFAICSAIMTIVRPELKGYVAVWGILVVVFDLFVFTPWEKNYVSMRLEFKKFLIPKFWDLIGMNFQ